MLGISGLLVRDLVQAPEQRNELLSAALVAGARIGGGVPDADYVTWFMSSGDGLVIVGSDTFIGFIQCDF